MTAGHDTSIDANATARLEKMYACHAPAVAAYVLRRSDPATVDDIVSEVFVVAWRRLADVPDDELPWLLATARRVLANTRRSRRRQSALEERLATQRSVGTPLQEGDWAILHALAQLSERDREAILLTAWEGLDSAGAATVLQIRRRTFDARLLRAKRRLARALEQERSAETTRPSNVKGLA